MKSIPWRAIRTRLILIAIAVGIVLLFPADTPGGNSLNDRVLGQAKNDLFNYVAWEADALQQKLVEQQAGLSPYLTEDQRSRFVHDYLQHVRTLQSLDAKINAIYSDPTVQDPAHASTQLRDQRAAAFAQVTGEQPLAEAIIDEQVSSVLRDEGFSTLGVVLPPVASHITELPMMLVVSPRNTIRLEAALDLVNMDTEQQVDLENSIDKALNVSSLVVPLGGLSLYPSMVIETSDAEFVFEVAAHEWTHHYLYFAPLGWSYTASGDTRTINETTASLMGKEVSVKVLRRFYADFPDIIGRLPAETTPTPSPQLTPTSVPQQTPLSFDYGAALNDTRITVDFLLKLGLVDVAEHYMDARRAMFATHGYVLRKLNQAFFAFYGGYQSPGSGAGGTDPIGPAIQEIRQRSPSLKAWLEMMRTVTSRDQLLAVRDTLRRGQ